MAEISSSLCSHFQRVNLTRRCLRNRCLKPKILQFLRKIVKQYIFLYSSIQHKKTSIQKKPLPVSSALFSGLTEFTDLSIPSSLQTALYRAVQKSEQ